MTEKKKAEYGTTGKRAAKRAAVGKKPAVGKGPAVVINTSYLPLKRSLDVVFSLFVLLLLSPLLLVLAVMIFADDPHASPFFRQERVGRGGRIFRLYKFRTMYEDAERQLENLVPRNEVHGPAFKIRDDTRITRVGKILRKSGLDEIPQFINVLRGEMSVVGPRPPLPREVAEYNDWQKLRLSVTPGITCYWQIKPKRNTLPFDEWVRLDLKYMRDMSLATDLRIMLLTIRAMVLLQGE